MSTIPRATHIKITELDTDEHKVFEAKGLIGLFKAMGKQVEEDIAKEAVEHYDAQKHQTTIRGVIVKANKQTLSRISRRKSGVDLDLRDGSPVPGGKRGGGGQERERGLGDSHQQHGGTLQTYEVCGPGGVLEKR